MSRTLFKIQEVSVSGSVSANTVFEKTLNPPSISGYTCVGLVGWHVNHSWLYPSALTKSWVRFFCDGQATTCTVTLTLLYIKS